LDHGRLDTGQSKLDDNLNGKLCASPASQDSIATVTYLRYLVEMFVMKLIIGFFITFVFLAVIISVVGSRRGRCSGSGDIPSRQGDEIIDPRSPSA
jgi:hypothetical protein